MNSDLQIIGKGGFAREVAAYYNNPNLIYYNKDFKMAEYDEIDAFSSESPTVIAIGDPLIRKTLYEKYKSKLIFTILNFAKIYVCREEDFFECMGAIICPGTIITTNVKIGGFVIINLNCTIGHDCKIGNFTTLSPGVNVSGNVEIGELCYIGTNAVIREGIKICDNVIIGAGGVVVKDITEPGTYVGNPVKKIK